MVSGFGLEGRDVCDRLEVLVAVEAVDLLIAATVESRPRNSRFQQTAGGEGAELERIEPEPRASGQITSVLKCSITLSTSALS